MIFFFKIKIFFLSKVSDKVMNPKESIDFQDSWLCNRNVYSLIRWVYCKNQQFYIKFAFENIVLP